MKEHYLEFLGNLDEEHFSEKPQVFQNETDGYGDLCVVDVYGSLFFEGKENEKPIGYFRHANPDSYRFAGFCEFGDTYIEPQKGGYHHDDIAQKNDPVIGYHKISDNPMAYQFSSEIPHSKYTFYLDHLDIEEGDFFRCTATPLPMAFVDHGCIFPPLTLASQPCMFKGTYEGKPVVGIGAYDRYCMPKYIPYKFGNNLGYLCAVGQGIREDGRLETVSAVIQEDGWSYGFYWLEGEEPVYSYDVTVEADWQRLPYCDDGTCTYETAVYRFADIEFHVQGKWGAKGFTKEPRIERAGQSHVFGTWYVGNTPYEHKIANSFCEHMECYDYKLEAHGHKVK